MNKLKYILLLVIMCFIVVGCGKDDTKSEALIVNGYEGEKGKTYDLENDSLAFHMDADTTQFSVLNKKSGETWYSNPQDADTDPIARNEALNALKSTLSVKYTTVSDVSATIDNFTYSIENKLYTIEEVENGIKVNYTIGKLEKSYLIPMALPESEMNAYFSKLDPAKLVEMKNYYRKIDINNLRVTDKKGELEAKYPEIKEEPMYELREGLAEHLKKKVAALFLTVGFTSEDYKANLERYEVSATSDKPAFNISIVYKLDGDDFLVDVPMEDIEYQKDYPIIELSVLPNMGAGGTKDKGFLLVPDGSGGIINFNNGKTTQAGYQSNVYGWDYGISRTAIVDENEANYPLFGIASNDKSFICVSEEGSAYAKVEADVSGKMSSYNTGKFTYSMLHGETVDITSKSDTTYRVFEAGLPNETISQRYIFVNSTKYSDMAVAYREYLMKRYPELKKNEDTSIPTAVELVGAVDHIEQVLGYPVTKSQALTTYDDATSILKELVDGGVQNMNVKYSGWFNQGLLHSSVQEVDTINRLGKKADLKELAEYSKKSGVNLYLDANFQFIYKNEFLDGFVANRDSSKFASRELAEISSYSPVWYLEDDLVIFNITKPSYALKSMDSYVKSIKKYGTNNVSFADIGKYLAADYNPKDRVSREAVLKLQQKKLAELSAAGNKLMLNADNMYSVPYADFVTNLNIDPDSFNLVDESIPFYQIVLHGLVTYSGEALNLSNNYDQTYLKSIETGAGLYYVFMKESTSALQDGTFTEFFGSDFEKWKDTTIESYKELNQSLGSTFNQFIVDHNKVDNNVFMTEYEDGTKVLVNYNYSPYTYNGKVVEARGYLVTGGAE